MTPAATTRLPYPGLRSFRIDETDLFFGRKECVNAMVDRLNGPHRFLAVLGTSGSGKSSLVRTGLVDALELGLLANAGSNWRIVTFRPEGQPLRSLARALLGEGASEADLDALRSFLARGPRSLVEWYHDGHLEPGENLLVLTDQFEELFRYEGYQGHEEAEAFVALLLESSRSPTAPIYVSLTMRSEYLGVCALMPGLAEAMNAGQFLVPRMTREHCRDAIEGPAMVCGFTIEPSLVTRLLNDLAEFAPWEEGRPEDQLSQLNRLARRADQLPLLQHALNQLWTRAAGQPQIVLTLADYVTIGGLRGALDGHAEQVLTGISGAHAPDVLSVAESVFRALVSGATVADAVRRPTRLADLVAIAGGKEERVHAVVAAFRAQGCNFLMPEPDVPLTPETYVDISHESLIRQWHRLSEWLVEEVRSSEAIRHLDEAAVRYRRGEADLLHGLDLANLLNWQSEMHPNLAWARRYSTEPEHAFAFLRDSERAADARSRRRWLVNFGVSALILVAIGFGLVLRNERAQRVALKSHVEETEIQRLRASDAREELAKQIKRTIDDFFTITKSRVAEQQSEGKLDLAGDLLGSLIQRLHGFAAALVSVDRELHLQMVEQVARFRAQPEPVDSRLELKTLGIGEMGRFALTKADRASSRFQIVDTWTGAVVAQGSLPSGERVEPASRHYLAPDGQRAVLRAASEKLFYWSFADGSVRPLRVELNKEALLLSVVQEEGSRRLAITIFDSNKLSVILFDNDVEVTPVPVDELFWQLRTDADLGQDASVGVRKAAPDVRLVWLRGSSLVAELRDGDWAGLITINLATGTARWLVKPNVYQGSLPSPDGILSVRLWRTAEACRVSRELAISQEVEADQDNVLCLAIVDLATGQNSYPSIVLPDSYPLRSVAVEKGQSGAWVYNLEFEGEMGDSLTSVAIRADDGPIKASHAPDSGRRIFGSPRMDRSMSATLVGAPVFDRWTTEFTTLDGSSRQHLVRMNAEGTEVRVFRLPATFPKEGGMSPLEIAKLSPTVFTDIPVDKLPSGSSADKPSLRDVRTSVDAAGEALVLAYRGQFMTLRLSDRERTGWGPPQISECSDAATDATEIVVDAIYPLPRSSSFIASDKRQRVWRIDLPRTAGRTATRKETAEDETRRVAGTARSTGTTEGELQPNASQILATCQNGSRGSEILAVDPASGRTLIYSSSRGLLIAAFASDVKADGNILDKGARVMAMSDRPLSAAFLDERTIALVSRSGGLQLIAERDTKWDVSVVMKAIWPDVVAITARGKRVLLASNHGAAALVDLSGEPRVIAAGMLPKVKDLLDDGETIEARESENRPPHYFRLAPVPPDDTIMRVIETRQAPPTPADDDLLRLGTSVLAGTREVARSAASESGEMSCGAALNMILAEWEDLWRSRWEADIRLKKSLDKAETACAARIEADAVTRTIVAAARNAVLISSPVSDDQTVVWPTLWSDLLAASADVRPVSTRALALTLLLSGDARARVAGEELWRALLAQGTFVSADEVAAVAAGAALPDGMQRALDSGEEIDPRVHRIRAILMLRFPLEVDRLRHALAECLVVERIYSSIDQLTTAPWAKSCRANLARLLPAEEVEKALGEARSWKPPSEPPPAMRLDIPIDQTARLRADLERVDKLARQLSEPGGLPRMQMLLLHAAGEPISPGNSDAVEVDRRFAALALSTLTNPQDFTWRKAVGAVADRLAGTEPQLSLRLRLRLLQLQEAANQLRAPSDGKSVEVYRMLLESLLDSLSITPGIDAAIADEFHLATSPISWSTVADVEQRLVVNVLAKRLRFIETLSAVAPTRGDLAMQRGVTRFWLGAIANKNRAAASAKLESPRRNKLDQAAIQQLKGEGEEAKSKTLEYYRASASDLRGFRGSGGEQYDVSYYLARMLRSTVVLGSAAEALHSGREAIDLYQKLTTAIQSEEWENKPSEASFYSEYSFVFRELAYDIIKHDVWTAGSASAKYLAYIMEVIYLSTEWDRTRSLAIDAPGSEWGVETGQNRGLPYAVATLAGALRLEDPNRPAPDDCDLASAPFDPLRRAPGVNIDDIPEGTESVCREAVKDESDLRAMFQLGRILQRSEDDTGRYREGAEWLLKAAKLGYPAAYNNLSFALSQSAELFDAYRQRVLTSSFAPVYRALNDFVAIASDSDRSRWRISLEWFVKQAARLRIPEAQLAMVELQTEATERKFRLLLASRLFEERQDKSGAARAKAEATIIRLDPKGEEKVAERITKWDAEEQEKLIQVSDDIVDKIMDQ